MYISVPVMAAILLAVDDDPKPETPPAPVQEVLDKYLKAIATKDSKAMATLAEVPWLDRDRNVVRDRAGLAKSLERVAGQLPSEKGNRKIEAFPYRKLRDRTKDEAERKLLDEMLGDNGWMISVIHDDDLLSERFILIRMKANKAAVVGGPLKQNQITPHNRIPESVDRLFDKAETFELYSLDPAQKFDKAGKVVEAKDGFHDWAVLGKTEVKDKAERRRLTGALRLGAEDNFGMAAACFIPRHGIRLKDSGKTTDLVICFECLQVQVFVDGERKAGFLTTGAPQPAFDAILKAADVKLPKPAKQ
jgi:hypothetical protein